MILNCLRCSGEYEQPRRRASHFCPPCRADRNRENTLVRVREVRARLRDVVLDITLDENTGHQEGSRAYYIDLMDGQAESLFARAGDYVDALDPDILWPFVPDRAPVGTTSPRGSDDGCSTNYTDLAEWLDQRAKYIASGQWFLDNPHWSYALADQAEAARYLDKAA